MYFPDLFSSLHISEPDTVFLYVLVYLPSYFLLLECKCHENRDLLYVSIELALEVRFVSGGSTQYIVDELMNEKTVTEQESLELPVV